MTAKILIKRRFKPGNSPQIISLLNEIRTMAMNQYGYLSGETLHKSGESDQMVVISTWRSIEDWYLWRDSEQRKQFESMLEIYQDGPTQYEEYIVGTPLR